MYGKDKVINTLRAFLNFLWRSGLVAVAYLAGLILAGVIAAVLGERLSAGSDNRASFLPLFMASILLGVLLSPFASHLVLSRRQHLLLWGSLILFNVGSVTIEGAYFAPDLISIPIPVLILQQLLGTLGAAFVITRVFASIGSSALWRNALQKRTWYSWVWRFILSAVSYLMFYFIVGGLNYQLVTKPYYESHAGGLTVPAVQVVFVVESIRSVLIVFSVFLFLLSMCGTRRQLMFQTGWLLFAIGGIVPLVWRIGALPLFLLAASAVEIFFQNFLTGVVAALLLGLGDSKGGLATILVEP
jgi:hypothetical protein